MLLQPDKTEAKQHSNTPTPIPRTKQPHTWEAVNSTERLSKSSFPTFLYGRARILLDHNPHLYREARGTVDRRDRTLGRSRVQGLLVVVGTKELGLIGSLIEIERGREREKGREEVGRDISGREGTEGGEEDLVLVGETPTVPFRVLARDRLSVEVNAYHLGDGLRATNGAVLGTDNLAGRGRGVILYDRVVRVRGRSLRGRGHGLRRIRRIRGIRGVGVGRLLGAVRGGVLSEMILGIAGRGLLRLKIRTLSYFRIVAFACVILLCRMMMLCDQFQSVDKSMV